MIEEKIEMVLITYNRYMYLDRTLSQLLESPFAKCKITVLDNCSTDKTPDICSKYQNLFHDMHVVRHAKNIGANPNILRAVETSNSVYTWILCDDDDYDFSDCDDLIEAIESEKFDLIINFSLGFKDDNGRTIYQLLNKSEEEELFTDDKQLLSTSGKELFDIIGQYYFLILSFVPASIFKTDLYDSECLMEGYNNIHNLYPHFKFIVTSIEKNFSIYKTKKDIVIRGTEVPITHTILFWLVAWLDSSLMIKDIGIRKTVTSNYYYGHSLMQMIVYSIMLSKVNKEENFRNLIISLMGIVLKIMGLGKGLLFSFLIILVSIVPRFIYKFIQDKRSFFSSSKL